MFQQSVGIANGKRGMEMQTYNNTFFSSISLFLILKHNKKWNLSETALILPIATQAKIIESLNRRKRDLSLLDMIVDKSENFYNFNKMFNSYKIATINALSILIEMDLIEFDGEDQVVKIKDDYSTEKIEKIVQQNKRLIAINKSSEKIAKMLKDKTEITELYIQLGVII